ncbi:MAG TPA: methyltransferase domain-containing protein [Terriglobales bacterium]|nr:methyltransferase domain-containing protein [Terriglobales bacterium]
MNASVFAPPAQHRTLRFRSGLRLQGGQEAPFHDYPLREEILFQYSGIRELLGGSPAPKILEAGPGSGFAAHLLSRQAELVLADVSASNLTALRAGLAGVKTWQVELGGANVAVPSEFGARFDFAFGLDMLQYVADPGRCFQQFGAVLRPQGELFLTFPNQVADAAGHRCWFDRSERLLALLRSAGFARVQLFAITLRAWARVCYALAHDRPLALLRRATQRAPASAAAYDQTWAFRQSRRAPALRWAVHAWWGVLGPVMALGGPRFHAEPLAGAALGHRLVIRAWKGA